MATKTGYRSGSRQQHPQQSSHHTHRTKKRDNTADAEEDPEKSQDSIESPLTPASPRCLSRDDVLAALGYRSDSLPQPSPVRPVQTQRSNACQRCAKKVYPLELIDIGDCYHRGCFKCYVRVLASVGRGFCCVAVLKQMPHALGMHSRVLAT